MKLALAFISLCVFVACGQEENEPFDTLENTSFFIAPVSTNEGYSSGDKDHYVIRNSTTHVNQMLLFIGGTSSTPKNYNLFCEHAASLGLDVVSLSYINSVPAASLASKSDILAFDHYREEICFGTQVSEDVEVDALNSLNRRIINLLRYLSGKYPDQNWGQYLSGEEDINWSKVIVAGHSQGAGHAAYISKKKKVIRSLMFSGPNDYSTKYEKPASWLSNESETDKAHYYALLHVNDQIVSYQYQVANLRALGMIASSQNPTLVDDLEPPFASAKALSIEFPTFSNHNAPIGRFAVLPPIWEYMLLGD